MIKIHHALRDLKGCEVHIIKFKSHVVYQLKTGLYEKDMTDYEYDYFKKHMDYFSVKSMSAERIVYKTKIN